MDLLVRAPRLFDGERVVENGAVALRDGVIVAVGSSDELDVGAERTIELADATLLPGFVDLHVHGRGEGQVNSVVTTVRDVGSPDAVLPLPPPAPQMPRVLAAGPLITAPGGYPIASHGAAVARVVHAPADARAYVRSLASRGAAVIKVSLEFSFPVVSRDVLDAIVSEAHARGLRVTAHVSESRGARLALAAGVDELAHMPCEVDAPLMRELAAADVEIVGTLHVVRDFGCPPVLENARAFVAAGGRLLYGSDYGNAGVPLGLDVVELELMADAGLSPAEVLANATAHAGVVTGVEGVGRLTEGSPADVVAFAGDPTRSLPALRGAPLLLIVRGELVLGA